MIKSIWIDNFKSLVDFKLELSDFTCLVGLNGAGKSTVLQVMDFLAQLMKGDLDGWLEQRQWSYGELLSKSSDSNIITIKMVVQINGDLDILWLAEFDTTTLSCISERISQHIDDDLSHVHLQVEDGKLTTKGAVDSASAIREAEPTAIIFSYQGSILSSLKDSQLSKEVLAFSKAVSQIHSLELLSPEKMRLKVRNPLGPMGMKGEKLAHFIDSSGLQGKAKLLQELEVIYPSLRKIDTHQTADGWIDLRITEQFDGSKITSSAQHMNDGMLRLMAIFSFLRYHSNTFSSLLFDEIENGINPELVEFLVDYLVAAKSQIMVTTHSPMILNFLEDEVARKSVIYLYKNDEGYTRATRLFAIPSLNGKLDWMGPGEAFVDTDLTRLHEEINAAGKAG